MMFEHLSRLTKLFNFDAEREALEAALMLASSQGLYIANFPRCAFGSITRLVHSTFQIQFVSRSAASEHASLRLFAPQTF